MLALEHPIVNRGEQEDTTISTDGRRITARLLVISLLLSIIGLSTVTLGQRPSSPLVRAGKTPPARFPIGQMIAGFRVVAHYTNHTERVVGLRLTHLATGLPLHFLWMDTAPQAAIMIRTYPDADHGAAHALEHLLLGKGTTGRALQTLADMRLGSITAGTAERYTWYHFYTGGGTTSFYEVLGQLLEALFHADFSDAEAQQEVYQIGVATEPRTGQRWLTEQGTVYTEMHSQQGMYDSWYALLKLVLGPDHPLTFQAGGTPDAIRRLTPQEIRRFHRQHYVLGPSTPLVIVMDRQQPPEQVLTGLERLLSAFEHSESNAARRTIVARNPRILPAERRELRLVPWPSKDATDPAPTLFGWPPAHLPSLDDRLRLDALLAALAQGSQSILYRRLVDRQTRDLDLGATGVDSMLLPTYDPAWPVSLVWIEGIPGDRVTIERLEEARSHVQATLRDIASYPDGSGELLALNRQIIAYLTARRRALTVWHASPPGFGQRRLEGSWLEHLELLDQELAGRRPLDWQLYWPRLGVEIESGTNIWRGVIERAGLLNRPYGTAAIPSPALLQQLDQERQARLTAALAAIQQRYDGADEQEALRRFEAEQANQQAQHSGATQQMALPTFTMQPPRTFDDTLSYAQLTIAGVPAVASYVEGAALTEIGLAFDLQAVPRHLYRYLPLLPALLRSAGVQEGEGGTPYRAFEEHIQRHLYRLETRYSVAPEANRYELMVTASGVGLKEFSAALESVQSVTHANALQPDNLSRIADLLQQHLSIERTLTHRPEEEWIETLAQAFRYQDNHLYLSLMAPPTRAHHLHRLAWQLAGPVPMETLQDLQVFANRLLASLRAVSGTEMAQKLAEIQETGLRGQLVDYWRSQLQAWPPALVQEGLQRLSAEALADLQVGPAQAIQDMRELQGLILNRSRLRLWLMGDRRVLQQAHPHVDALVRSFSLQDVEAPRVDATPVVWPRLHSRHPDLAIGHPAYVGYVHEGSLTGNVVVTAKGPTYRDLDESSVIAALAGKSLAGTGPHTWYKKTWEAGLAYGNGLDLRPREGIILYYADRCPSVRATLAFIRAMAEEGSPQSTQSSAVDYALAQIFAFSRTALSPSARAEAMAIDLREGLTPERLQRFSQILRRLRSDPQLRQRLRNTLPRVTATVTLRPEHRALQSAAQAVFFVIAPESQLAELESDVPGKLLPRVWPSDFWLE
jgi:Zn-dependent M16 (insulinase) family peptidase